MKIKYPKKICENCSHVTQMHFDISKEWDRVKYTRCPVCHKPLFESSESIAFYKISDYEKEKLKRFIKLTKDTKKLSAPVL